MEKSIKQLFSGDKDLDDRSVEFLGNALSTNSMDGFDYIKFKMAVQKMAEMNIPEDTAFQTVFATASTMGVNKEKLVKTAMHYKKVLNAEKKQFDSALKNQMKQRVAAKKEETVYLQEKIKEYKSKIEELRTHIQDYELKLSTADEEIQSAKEKIQMTAGKFEETYQTFSNVIDTDIDKIKTFL